MPRTVLLTTSLLLAGLATGAITPRNADAGSDKAEALQSKQAEPTRENCATAMDQARALAAALPAGDLSRYFAERHLHQAMIEANNGEFDDCLEWTARAIDEVKERRHVPQPGETLKVLRPNE